MERQNNISTYIKDLKCPKHLNTAQFPNISNRKSKLAPEQIANLSSNSNNNFHYGQTKNSPQQRKKSIFSMPKDTVYLKNQRCINQKQSQPSKLYSTLEGQIVKKKIDKLRKYSQQGFMNIFDTNMFNCVLKQFDQQLIQPKQYAKNSHKGFLGNKRLIKQAQRQKNMHKPRISQSSLNNSPIQFINISKMRPQNNKKSCNLLVRSIPDIQSDAIFYQCKQINKFNRTDQPEQNNKTKACNINSGKLNNYQQQDNQLLVVNNKCFSIQTSQRKFLRNKIYINEINLTKKQSYQENIKEINEELHDLLQQQQQQQKDKVAVQKQKKSTVKRFSKKFNPPFDTYYYRDFLWKVNYSNQLCVEIPLQYEHKLKVFVGKGNNSCMVSGLITRRTWLAFTEKIQQASFVWTQIKRLDYFKKQPNYKEQLTFQRNLEKQYQGESIITESDSKKFKNYFKTYFISQQNCDQKLLPRIKFIKYRTVVKHNQIKDQKLHNHLINNYVIGNKKALFNTMANYYQQINEDVFSYLPLTFHVKDGIQDKQYFQFLKYYMKKSKQIAKNSKNTNKKQRNTWIIKPGQNSNRGNGIKMCLKLDEIKQILRKRQKYADGSYRTYIIQAYIERPLLYYKRKFDLRHYIMMTSINGIIKGYWYKYGYVRTTSTEYTLNDNLGSIHLTNDAVQKNLPDYGKYQKGNKISYDQLSLYIQKYHNKKGKNFYDNIYPKMKKMATDSMRACSGGIDPDKLQNNFEIFGMDFMIDSNLDVWLIQINTNPCLELSCPLLGCIIPKMVENALQYNVLQHRLTLDAIFPPPVKFISKGLHFYKQLQKQNKFELVFDQRVQNLSNAAMKVLDHKLLEQQDDTFQDCGQNWQDS